MNSIHPDGTVTSDCYYCDWESGPQESVGDSMRAATAHMQECEARADYFTALGFPVGATVAHVVHGIGGRSERVTGTVTGYTRRQILVKTENHGTLCVPLDRAELVAS